jgi:hypothetical protein
MEPDSSVVAVIGIVSKEHDLYPYAAQITTGSGKSAWEPELSRGIRLRYGWSLPNDLLFPASARLNNSSALV